MMHGQTKNEVYCIRIDIAVSNLVSLLKFTSFEVVKYSN